MGLDVAPRQLGAHYRDVRRRLFSPPCVAIAAAELRETKDELCKARVSLGEVRQESRRLKVELYAAREEIAALHHQLECFKSGIDEPNLRPTMAHIKRVVAQKYGLRPLHLDSDSRRTDVVRPRQIAMHFCRHLTAHSIPEIGRAFNRDHTTAIHAFEKIEELSAIPEFKNQLEQIERAIIETLRPASS